ncbi:MAG: hypothetical protein KY439_11635 [Actinobacteria bacterium]|nr:hypothetical protein [Actinomycetota bacterium]
MSDQPLQGSPFAGRPRRRARNRAIVAASLAGVAVAAVLMALVVRFASQRPDEVELGAKVLRFDARRLARDIEQQNEPLLFKDPLTSRPGREVYVQHLGADPKKGWVTIDAYAPGQRRDIACILDWQRDTRQFRDPCSDPPRTFPADGSGLPTYPTTVDGNAVIVDLRSQE